MGQNPQAPRIVPPAMETAASLPAPPFRALRSGWTGWLSGLLFVSCLGLACVHALPWGLSILPLALLAGFLAVRAAEEWPRIGFPVCVLGVGLLVAATALFKMGVDWSRDWDAGIHSGQVDAAAGVRPILGIGLAILLGGGFLGVLFLHGETVWRALSSIRLAVVTLASIGVLSVIGTMVVQRFGAGSLPEPEKQFIEKFMKGQGAVPVNAAFMLSPPKVLLTVDERKKIDLVGAAFGPGKARQLEMETLKMRATSTKAMAIERHVEARREHLLALFERLDALGFTNVFRTWWFNALLVLVFVQLVAILVKRWPWGWMQSGWVMTHVGVITVLVGCVLSDGLLKDGALALSPGESADRFEEYTRLDARRQPTRTELGYRVRMLGTDQSFYHHLEIAFPRVAAGDDILWTQEQLREGKRIEVKDPGTGTAYGIRIVESHERALVELPMVSAARVGRTGGDPVLRVRFLQDEAPGHDHGHAPGEHALDEGYLFADGFYTGNLPPYLVRYRRAATEEEAKDLLAGKALEGQGKHGTLLVQIPGLATPLAVPATPGETARANGSEGTVWQVRVLSYDPEYRVGEPGAPVEPGAWPRQPVLVAEVRKGDGPDGAGKMLVYADTRLQAQWEGFVRHQGSDNPHGGALEWGRGPAGECSWRFDFAPPVQTWVVESPSGARTLVAHRQGASPEPREFQSPGTRVPVGPPGVSLELVEAIPDAVADLQVTPLAQETDGEYLRTCLRAVDQGVEPPVTVSIAKVEVRETEKGAKEPRVREQWLVAAKPGVMDFRDFLSTDGRLILRLAETKNALMYRSALEVQDLEGKPLLRDGQPVRQVVRVNHPLQWGGYAFYQNSFQEASGRGPAVSVFRVKYDRGIPTIYTGFAVLTLGVCLMLYLNPLLRRGRGKGSAAAPEGGAGKETHA